MPVLSSSRSTKRRAAPRRAPPFAGGLPRAAGLVLAMAPVLHAAPAAHAAGAPVPGEWIAAVWGVVLAAAGAVAVAARVARRRTAAAEARAEAAARRAGLLEAAVSGSGHGALVFAPGADEPEAVGRVPEDVRTRFAAEIAALRRDGTPFRAIHGNEGGMRFSVTGEAAGTHAIVRIAPAGGERRGVTEAGAQPGVGTAAPDGHPAALEALPHPAWTRDGNGRLGWANAAYAAACGAASPAEAVARGDELLDGEARAALREAAATDGPVRVTTVANGQRRTLDVTEIAAAGGTFGIAVDVTELERTRAALERTVDYHAATLDQLATAVAIFGPDRRLRFHNQAYQDLWRLEPAFLDGAPEDEVVLGRLRAARRLPEQSDFRSWAREATRAYQSLEGYEDFWHLPDGRTLRVIAAPHPHGGVTYIYENVTERLDLESRYNALSRVQSETLDNLGEGVATFGADGLLTLSNPAFTRIWRGADGAPLDGRHVRDIARDVARTEGEIAAWQSLADAVTGLTDHRASRSGRFTRADGTTFDYASVPLPDGSTLTTFADVTDSVRVERALTERNEALVQADRLKDAFIGHVSYALRTPLNSILGFTEMLTSHGVGPLNARQREYAGYIAVSSQALRAIIDDVLDLATIDAGIMQLDLGEVAIRETVDAVAEALKDRLRAAGLELVVEVPAGLGTFEADAKRVRQVLFNVMSNAIEHSRQGGRITVACRRAAGRVVFAVADTGKGIAADKLDTIFDRFVSAPSDRHRGVGLGLSIVKSFVDLHGGTVSVATEPNVGTTVTIAFPERQGAFAEAAAAE